MDAPRLPWLRIGLVVAAVAALILLRVLLWPDVGARDVRGVVDRAGPWAPLALLLAFVLGTAALLPVTLFNLAAGALWPLPQALALAYFGTLAAAQAHFWLAHAMGPHLRHALERRVPRAVAHMEDRSVPVLLALRIVPVFPFAPTDYALGLSRVPWRMYTVTGAVGHVPGTVVTVLVGAALLGFDAGSWRFWLLLAGLVVAVLALGGLVWFLMGRYGGKEWME